MIEIGSKIKLKNDPCLREYAAQEVTIVEFHAEYSAGKSYVVAFEDGREDILNEAHFEAEVAP